DGRRLAENLGSPFMELPIGEIVEAFERALAEPFAGRDPDLTEENIQARARGVLLMALSNKFGWMLVATGNKSELSVGYATLYGDMAGGFALLKDVYKTDVFRLARYLNERVGKELIPQSIIDRAPSSGRRRSAATAARRSRTTGAVKGSEPAQALAPRDSRVGGRRGRQHEEPRPGQPTVLLAELRPLLEHPAIGLLPDEGDPPRPEGHGEMLEPFGGSGEVSLAQVSGPGRRARRGVRDADAFVQQGE